MSIPMSVPRVGGNQQQPQFDINQAVYKKCVCGFDYFDKVFEVGVISDLAPGKDRKSVV